MPSYRFKREQRYRRRRFVLSLILVLGIAFAVYFFVNKNNGQANNTTPSPTAPPTTSETPPATSNNPTVAPPSDIPSESPSESPSTPEQSATPTSSPASSTPIADHGVLPAIGSVEASGKMDELKAMVEEFISKQAGKYGVTFIDLATNESFGIKDTDEYIAASTSKLPMNVLLFTKIESGEVDPESMLTYKEQDFEPGTGVIQNSDYGTEYSVRETSKLSVIHSDNCGINMIIDLLGIENIRQYIVDLGGVVYYGNRHRSCPHDMALVSKELYRLYVANPNVYGELIYNLEHTDWNDRINAQLPTDVKVAHKIGNQTRTANDVGIVFASHPYVLSIMTDNVDFGTACKKIGELSKLIYEFVEAYANKAQ